jgi:hypothetical protein
MALSKSDTITISGIVPPAKRIIVNDNGQIQSIISNCTFNAPLYIYITRDMTVETNLTDNIVRQYNIIKSSHNLDQIGTVYTYSSLSPAPKFEKSKNSSFQLSNLFLNNFLQKF